MRTPPPTVHLFDTHPKPVPPAFPPEGLSVFGCLHISRNLIFQAAPAVARVATSYPRCPLTAPVKARRASARSDASCGATWHPRPRRAISTWRPREDLAGVGLQTRVPGRATRGGAGGRAFDGEGRHGSESWPGGRARHHRRPGWSRPRPLAIGSPPMRYQRVPFPTRERFVDRGPRQCILGHL
jgi:hypothetical protein